MPQKEWNHHLQPQRDSDARNPWGATRAESRKSWIESPVTRHYMRAAARRTWDQLRPYFPQATIRELAISLYPTLSSVPEFSHTVCNGRFPDEILKVRSGPSQRMGSKRGAIHASWHGRSRISPFSEFLEAQICDALCRQHLLFPQMTSAATGTVPRSPLMTTMPESVTCQPRARSAPRS